MADNFEAVDLSWIKDTTDPLEVLKQGSDFLEDPSKISINNRERWCNLHVTPALQSIVVEVRSLEEVSYWAKKGRLGSASDPTVPGIANLIATFGITPWPRTLGLARVHVAPNQKLCSVSHAVESAKERFKLDDNMESPYYYLTPVSTEAPYILSDVGLQNKDDVTRVIGVAAMCVNPADNTVDLTASEGPTCALMAHRLLHLEDSSVLIPPQLSCPAWTGMRRATIRYESFIRFIAPYAPPEKSEVDIATHQLGSIQNLVVPEPTVLLFLADQLENLKSTPAELTEAVPEPREEEEGTKEETPKKTKSTETDPPRKHHKSREEKSRSRHNPTEKSPASSSREHIATLDTDKLGDAVAQACLSVVRMSRVVEKAHHSNTSQAWLVRQHLEKASIEAVDSMKDEIQGARTLADMWRVEKKIGAQVSRGEGQGLPGPHSTP